LAPRVLGTATRGNEENWRFAVPAVVSKVNEAELSSVFWRNIKVKKLIVGLLWVCTTAYGSVIKVTDPTTMPTTDFVQWGQLLNQGSQVSSYITTQSTTSDWVFGYLPAGGSIVTAPTENSGVQAGDDLLAANGGSLQVTPVTPIYGIGAYIDGDGVDPFTATIQVFTGVSSVLESVTSTDGDPIFLGASDGTSQAITRVIFSLTSGGAFELDSLYIQNTSTQQQQVQKLLITQQQTQSGVPEPGTASLLGIALLTTGFTLRKRIVRI